MMTKRSVKSPRAEPRQSARDFDTELAAVEWLTSPLYGPPPSINVNRNKGGHNGTQSHLNLGRRRTTTKHPKEDGIPIAHTFPDEASLRDRLLSRRSSRRSSDPPSTPRNSNGLFGLDQDSDFLSLTNVQCMSMPSQPVAAKSSVPQQMDRQGASASKPVSNDRRKSNATTRQRTQDMGLQKSQSFPERLPPAQQRPRRSRSKIRIVVSPLPVADEQSKNELEVDGSELASMSATNNGSRSVKEHVVRPLNEIQPKAIDKPSKARQPQRGGSEISSSSLDGEIFQDENSIVQLARQLSSADLSGTMASSAVQSQFTSLASLQISSKGAMQPRRVSRITLHIYDLIGSNVILELPFGCLFPIGACFGAINSSLHTLGTGAYHVGIEVDGVEYAYGSTASENNSTGVYTCTPKHSPGYQYRTSVSLGERSVERPVYVLVAEENQPRVETKPKDGIPYLTVFRTVDGREIMRELANEYLGKDYDLLRKNCCTFAHDAALRLGVPPGEIPSWFTNLALVGAATKEAALTASYPITSMLSTCKGKPTQVDAAPNEVQVQYDVATEAESEMLSTFS